MSLGQAMQSGRVDTPSYKLYKGPPRPLTARMLKRMNIPKRYWRATLDEVTEGKYKALVTKYVVNIRGALEGGFGMILNGDVGTGKSSIAALCLKQARRIGASGLFITAADYITSAIQNRNFDDSTTVAERCRDVDLLVIDDLAKEAVNLDGKKDGTAAMLEALVKDRCSSMKSTIITMNLVRDELEKLYGASMLGMLRETAPIVHVSVGSKRSKDGVLNFYGLMRQSKEGDDG